MMMQARRGVSKDTANGPEDIIVTEMIQELPTRVLHVTTACCKVQISRIFDAPSSWEVVQLVLVRKLDAKESKSIRGYRADGAELGDGEVVRVGFEAQEDT